MAKDDRDILNALKFELQFLEKGGYGRSPRGSRGNSRSRSKTHPHA